MSAPAVHPGLDLRLDEVLAERAATTPSATAIEDHRHGAPRDCTWEELEQAVQAEAKELEALGLPAGSRVAVVLEDSIPCMASVFAVFRAGLVLVPVDARWGDGLHRDVVAMSGCRMRVRCGAGGEVDREVLAADPARRAPLDPEVALISYTSGSTSDPKGVVLRHRHLRAAYAAGVHYLLARGVPRPRRYGDVMRVSGLGVLGVHYFFALEFGATTVVLPELGFGNAVDYLATVRDRRIDMTYLVPALLELVVRRALPVPGAERLTALCGGAPMREEAQRSFQDRSGALLLNAYGATEMAFAVFFGDRDEHGRGTPSVGTPALGEARIRADDGSLVGGPGEGELELRGPSRADGYWMNPAATAEVFVGDWYRTGDIVRRDDRGRYVHRGRVREIVLRGGFTIHLSEVEDAVLSVPGVLDACAVRIRPGELGEDVGVVARVEPGVAASTLLDRCRAHLGADRAPRHAVLTAGPIPRVPNGKVDRRAAERLWRRESEGAGAA